MPLETIHTDTEDQTVWLVTDALPTSGVVWVWVWVVPVLAVGMVSPPYAVLLGIGLIVVMLVGVFGESHQLRHGWRVSLSRQGVNSAWVSRVPSKLHSALVGEVGREATLSWDDLAAVERREGQILLRRADGVCVALPVFPLEVAEALEQRIRAECEAYNARATPRAEAEAHRHRVVALLGR